MRGRNNLVTLGLLHGALAMSACGSDSPSEDAPNNTTPGFVSYLLQPETISLLPGECSVSSLTWSGKVELTADQVEWEAPSSLRITPTVGNGFQFCAGFETGEGDINVRLVGADQFQQAGRGFVRELGPDGDPNPYNPTWTRGRTERPNRILWSADGKKIYATTWSKNELTIRDAETLAIESIHFIGSEDMAFLGDDKIAVGEPSAKVGVYSLIEKRLITSYNAISFQPLVGSGDVSLVSAGEGITASVARNKLNGSCTVSAVDLRNNKHTLIATGSGTGFVPESGVVGGPWSPESGVGARLEEWIEMSRSGRYVLLGPRGCWTTGTTLIDLETEETILNCMPDRNAKPQHRAVMSEDGSTIASIVNNNVNPQGYAGIGIADTDGCKPRGSAAMVGEQTGIALSSDGNQIASLTTGGFDARTGIQKYHLWVTDSSPAAYATPSTQKRVEHIIEKNRPSNTEPNFNHRLAFSPDGKRIAIAFVTGQIGVYDIATDTVVLEAPIDWGTAEPTPDARFVLAMLHDDDGQGIGWAMVDTQLQQVVRTHDPGLRFVAAYPDGYVLRSLALFTFYDYETGTEIPFVDGAHGEKFVPDNNASDDGSASCSVDGAQVCIGTNCASADQLTRGKSPLAQGCVMLNNETAVFVAGGMMWRWPGAQATAIYLGQPSDEAGDAKIMRLRDGEIMARNPTHLTYWKL